MDAFLRDSGRDSGKAVRREVRDSGKAVRRAGRDSGKMVGRAGRDSGKAVWRISLSICFLTKKPYAFLHIAMYTKASLSITYAPQHTSGVCGLRSTLTEKFPKHGQRLQLHPLR